MSNPCAAANNFWNSLGSEKIMKCKLQSSWNSK